MKSSNMVHEKLNYFYKNLVSKKEEKNNLNIKVKALNEMKRLFSPLKVFDISEDNELVFELMTYSENLELFLSDILPKIVNL